MIHLLERLAAQPSGGVLALSTAEICAVGFDEVFLHPALGRIDGLNVQGSPAEPYGAIEKVNAATAALFAWTGLARLQTLSVSFGWQLLTLPSLAVLSDRTDLALTSLTITECLLEDAHAALFTESHAFDHLETLSLAGNSIRVDGARALAAARLPALRDLNLWSNAITVEGLKAFGDRSGLPALARIGAGNNQLGDDLWEDWIDGWAVTGGNWRPIGDAQMKALFGDRLIDLY